MISKEARATYRQRNKAKIQAYDKQWRTELKKEAFEHYGGAVCPCGENRLDALHLDHINSDGSTHRKMIGITTGPLYRWVKNNGFPDGFRVLCANCNVLAYLDFRSGTELSSNRSARSKRKRGIENKCRLMERLGNRCAICGKDDIRILTIHHINHNGAEHRREISHGRGSWKFYEAILKVDDLTGLECRCFSCNDAEH